LSIEKLIKDPKFIVSYCRHDSIKNYELRQRIGNFWVWKCFFERM